jgi:mono/diheme cytochrome c family protein
MLKLIAGLLAISIFSVADTLHAEEPARVVDGLLAFYTFAEADEGIILDRSEFGEPVHLRIDKPQLVTFRNGRMSIGASLTIASDGPAKKIIDAIKATNELTIETWLTPLDLRQAGPARIITLSTNPSERNFTLGQNKSRFDVRLRTTTTDDNGMPSVAGPEGSASTKLTHVVYSRSADGRAQITINGETAIEQTNAAPLDNWNNDFRLALANELTGDRPWLGELALVAIYRRALSHDEIRQNFQAGIPTAVDYASLLPAASQGQIDFVKQVQPILRTHCYECHSADQEDGGLNLGMAHRALQGGDHGPVFIPGDSVNSNLIHRIAALDPEKVMPPDSQGLNPEEIGLLRAWIDQGAAWPEGIDIPSPKLEQAKTHWAFQPLRSVVEPTVANSEWVQSPIDRFIAERFETARLSPNPAADPRRLIRRINFDLIGLPPTPQEVDDFCKASASDPRAATEGLVDRLLQSPHYGERWGRHWLDVARYADSDGQESDRDRPGAYHYRDFVIRAFNDDMPYDQFIRWQLAGDEYLPNNPGAVAATGFLAAGPFAALPDRLMEDERLRNRYNELDDIVSTIGTGMLGLTLGCVRCHDHKYDAIPARDYYSLLAAFHGGDRAEVSIGDNPEKMLVYRDLSAEPQPSWLFQRGNYYDRDQLVSIGFISVLTGEKSPEAYWQSAREQSPSTTSTKQRRALAEWITDAKQGSGALLARVIVNRLWEHHFSQGLVRTVGDFGARSEPPSHPELLEWLANDLVDHGWRLKRLQRMILLSAVYQQSSVGTAPESDRENRWLSKMPLQRLEGEILRDSMLAVSGKLDLKTYGPAVKPPIAAEAIVARNLKDGYPENIHDEPSLRRRSIYLFHKRVVPYPLLQAFDKPDAQQSCSRRDRTTVAPQALALMNDPFVRTVSNEFASRLISEHELNPARIEKAYQLALSRAPTPEELAAATDFVNQQFDARSMREPNGDESILHRQALADFCQVLFGLNEFLYVD